MTTRHIMVDVPSFDSVTREPVAVQTHKGNVCTVCKTSRHIGPYIHAEVQKRPDICNACVEKRDGIRMRPRGDR
jgi:hypothetical protein